MTFAQEYLFYLSLVNISLVLGSFLAAIFVAVRRRERGFALLPFSGALWIFNASTPWIASPELAAASFFTYPLSIAILILALIFMYTDGKTANPMRPTQGREAEQDGGGNALEPPTHPSSAPTKARATP